MKRQIAMMIMSALRKGNRMLLNQYKRMMGYDDTSKMVQEAQQMLKEAKPKQMLKPEIEQYKKEFNADLSKKALEYNERLKAIGSPLRIEKSSKVPGKTSEMYGVSGMPDEAIMSPRPAGLPSTKQLDNPDMIEDMMAQIDKLPKQAKRMPRLGEMQSPRMGPDASLTPFGQALETGRKGIDWLWDLVKKNPLNDKIL